jgi:hypothetical protein
VATPCAGDPQAATRDVHPDAAAGTADVDVLSLKGMAVSDEFKRLCSLFVVKYAQPKGQPNLTVDDFRDFVAGLLDSTTRLTISINTARKLLADLGFRYGRKTRQIYYDGHEKLEQVRYRLELFKPGGLYMLAFNNMPAAPADEETAPYDMGRTGEHAYKNHNPGMTAGSAGAAAVRARRAASKTAASNMDLNAVEEEEVADGGDGGVAAQSAFMAILADVHERLQAEEADNQRVLAGGEPLPKTKNWPVVQVAPVGEEPVYNEIHDKLWRGHHHADCCNEDGEACGENAAPDDHCVLCDFCQVQYHMACIPEGSSNPAFHLFACADCLEDPVVGGFPVREGRKAHRCSNCSDPFHTATVCRQPCRACFSSEHTSSKCPSAPKKGRAGGDDESKTPEGEGGEAAPAVTAEQLSGRQIFCCNRCAAWVNDPKRWPGTPLDAIPTSKCPRAGCGAQTTPLAEYEPEARERRFRYLVALKKVVMLSHDECSVHCADDQGGCWQKLDGSSAKMNKSEGTTAMISAFATSVGLNSAPGILCYKIIEPTTDGYWRSINMLAHLREAIAEGERRYPGMVLVFLFDHSSNHKQAALDTLNVCKMNKGPGGKAKHIMRDSVYEGKRQRLMTVVNGVLVTKGLLQLYVERGFGDEATVGSMSVKELKQGIKTFPKFRDFHTPITALEDLVMKAGHLTLFLPKYHCETNHIEYIWGALKRDVRKWVDGKMQTLRDFLPAFLENVRVSDVRKMHARSMRYVVGYGEGKTGYQCEAAVKADQKDRAKARVGLGHRASHQTPSGAGGFMLGPDNVTRVPVSNGTAAGRATHCAQPFLPVVE